MNDRVLSSIVICSNNLYGCFSSSHIKHGMRSSKDFSDVSTGVVSLVLFKGYLFLVY